MNFHALEIKLKSDYRGVETLIRLVSRTKYTHINGAQISPGVYNLADNVEIMQAKQNLPDLALHREDADCFVVSQTDRSCTIPVLAIDSIQLG
jgi:hypothetical protein